MNIGDKYYIQDIESGRWDEVSQSDYETYEKWRNQFSKMIIEQNGLKPRFQVVGTMSDPLENHKNYPLSKSEAFTTKKYDERGGCIGYFTPIVD